MKLYIIIFIRLFLQQDRHYNHNEDLGMIPVSILTAYSASCRGSALRLSLQDQHYNHNED